MSKIQMTTPLEETHQDLWSTILELLFIYISTLSYI